MNLQELYDTSIDFKLYVDAWCNKCKIAPTEAFKMIMVQEYAKVVLERNNEA